MLMPVLLLLVQVLAGAAMAQSPAGDAGRAIIANSAYGLSNGRDLNETDATVSLNRVGNAATKAIAEISPNQVVLHSVGNNFTYEIVPTIRPGDFGVDQVKIIVPQAFSDVSVASVLVGGEPQTLNNEIPQEGEFSKTILDGSIVLILGASVEISETPIQVEFKANATGPAGSWDVGCILVGAGRQTSAEPGNADGDPADANGTAVEIIPGADPLKTIVTVDPPIVLADGVEISRVTTVLLDANDRPVSGKGIVLSSSRGAFDVVEQPPTLTDENGVAIGSIRSDAIGLSTITAVDTTDKITAGMRPVVAFTQGVLLKLTKQAGSDEVGIGDLVHYSIAIENVNDDPVDLVVLDDQIPPNFKFLDGSARLNGSSLPDPRGNRTLSFDLGTIEGFVDRNGNGQVDPDEPGHLSLVYDLVVGTGAIPGEYTNRAVARDVCEDCYVSNEDEATVKVTLDPLFELGTVIGKVYEDLNEDGWQGPDEPGVAGAVVALDNGTYSIADDHGRYHFKAVEPGQRMLKVNLSSLPGPARATNGESRVVWVTPGILAKANFGLTLEEDSETIGHVVSGLAVHTDVNKRPIEIVGSLETLGLLINGERLSLPTADIELTIETPDEILPLEGGHLKAPLEFAVETDDHDRISGWSLHVSGEGGSPVHVLERDGTPPKTIVWDGTANNSVVVRSGCVYQYYLEVRFEDGSVATSPRRLFGADRRFTTTLRLPHRAFDTGGADLRSDARRTLAEAADILREYPGEKLNIEVTADLDGGLRHDSGLSRERAQATATYLVNERRMDPGQILPASTTTSGQGSRETSSAHYLQERRAVVSLKGATDRPSSMARINGSDAVVEVDGRFSALVQGDGVDSLSIEIADNLGRTVCTSVAVPSLAILEPAETIRLPYGEQSARYRVFNPPVGNRWGPDDVALEMMLVGRTDPDNEVILDGRQVEIAADGLFSDDLDLTVGRNIYGLLVTRPSGISRIANIAITVSDREEDGRLGVAVETVPDLTVVLPPKHCRLRNPNLMIKGVTGVGNKVLLNGVPTPTDEEGRFSGTVRLDAGNSDIVVEVHDRAGNVGRVKRSVTVAANDLFLLAFADGVAGVMKTEGYLEGAGAAEANERYTDGRIAYYLKGRIAGKYLVTSAFDTGRNEFNNLFDDIDDAGNDRLLTNLDPDRYYPVYGDESVTVYDTDSRGKFYLAVEGEEFDLLVGNYPLSFTDTELAQYQRTLYGGIFSYRSESSSTFGRPNTSLTLFGATSDRKHVRTELAATGGSLYYLKHGDVVEGSEQIAIIVRDKNSGLVLSRTPQIRNRDYTVKYIEGRLWFSRPVAGVVAGGSLIEQEMLAGNPVYIEVEYETEEPTADLSSAGGRLRQQVGDRFVLGGTFVKEDGNVEYELHGVDAELRFGGHSRILGEYVESTGSDSLSYLSGDGGISFGRAPLSNREDGKAWKAAAELDVGEWIGAPKAIKLGGYINRTEPGFFSGGTIRESGTEKTGLSVGFTTKRLGSLEAGIEETERLEDDVESQGPAARRKVGRVAWALNMDRIRFGAEYQAGESEYASARTPADASYLAAMIESRLTERASARLRHQSTLTGVENDQTTLGMTLELRKKLSLDASATTGSKGESAEGGLLYTHGKGRVYLTERYLADRAGKSTATVLGAFQEVGPASKVYTEYQWQRRTGRATSVSTVGAEREWRPSSGVKITATGEHARCDADDSQTRRSAFSIGVGYSHPRGVTGESRNEVRYTHESPKRLQFFSNSRVEVKLNPDYTVLGNFRLGVTRDTEREMDEARFEEHSLGIAYRPVRHDRLNGLARYTHIRDDRPRDLAGAGEVRTSTDVVSLESAFDITRNLEWVEKLAGKIKRFKSEGLEDVRTHTYLNINRLNINVWKRLGIGIEYRLLIQSEANDRKMGWLNELTWSANDHMRLGIGYNYTSFSDDEFSDNDYSKQGWFVRIQGIY